jgi:hypothetical protein
MVDPPLLLYALGAWVHFQYYLHERRRRIPFYGNGGYGCDCISAKSLFEYRAMPH